MIEQYSSFDEWYDAALDNGFGVESWGFGSKSAHNIDGRYAGEWIAEYDSSNGESPRGWLDLSLRA